ncbi:hypothetical protein ABPG75_008528 [Micractinium tetrahymenae]
MCRCLPAVDEAAQQPQHVPAGAMADPADASTVADAAAAGPAEVPESEPAAASGLWLRRSSSEGSPAAGLARRRHARGGGDGSLAATPTRTPRARHAGSPAGSKASPCVDSAVRESEPVAVRLEKVLYRSWSCIRAAALAADSQQRALRGLENAGAVTPVLHSVEMQRKDKEIARLTGKVRRLKETEQILKGKRRSDKQAAELAQVELAALRAEVAQLRERFAAMEAPAMRIARQLPVLEECLGTSLEDLPAAWLAGSPTSWAPSPAAATSSGGNLPPARAGGLWSEAVTPGAGHATPRTPNFALDDVQAMEDGVALVQDAVVQLEAQRDEAVETAGMLRQQIAGREAQLEAVRLHEAELVAQNVQLKADNEALVHELAQAQEQAARTTEAQAAEREEAS